MTTWRVGELAVCVDASPDPEWADYLGRADYCTLIEGRAYRVRAVLADGIHVGLDVGVYPVFAEHLAGRLEVSPGWNANRFRKLLPAEPAFTEAMRSLRPKVGA